jgi:long-chain acyl-CoA synthetase
VTGEEETIGARLNRACLVHKDRPALRFHGRVSTYHDLEARVRSAATTLRRLKAGPGVRVGLLLPGSPALIGYVYALFSLDATIVPLDPAAAQSKLDDAVTAAGVELLVTCDLFTVHEKALSLVRRGLVGRAVVVSHGAQLPAIGAAGIRLFQSYKLSTTPAALAPSVVLERDVLRDVSLDAAVTAQLPAAASGQTAILTTSRDGATLRLATQSQELLAGNLAQLIAALPPFQSGRERILVALPMWHPLALSLAINVGLVQGGELIIPAEFTRDALAEAMRRSQPSVLIASPPLLSALLEGPEAPVQALASLRYTVTAGGWYRPGLKARYEALTKAPLIESYGLELAPAVAAIGDPGAAVPLAGTRICVRDLADPARELPRGERGEICLAGPQIVAESGLSPPAGAFIGGFLRTGDLGLLDGGGRLVIVDRIEDLIVAAGYLIYPRRIETALLEHPDVEDAAVIGIRDGRQGNAPKAFVIARRRSNLTEDDLRRHLDGRLSKIELPAEFAFRQTLPRNAFGSVAKAELRREA